MNLLKPILVGAVLGLAACAPAAPPQATAAVPDVPPPSCAAVEGLGLAAPKGWQRLDPDLWHGTSRAELLALLEALPEAKGGLAAWPSLRRLLVATLTAPIDTGFLAQGPAPDEGAPDLLTARIAALTGLGMAREATELYATLPPAGPCSAAQARAGVEAMIAAGQGPLACVELQVARQGVAAGSADPFWANTAARCAPGAKSPLPDEPTGPETVARFPAPPEGASRADILGVLGTAHGQGTTLPAAWVYALSGMGVPDSRAGRRAHAFALAATMPTANRREKARRTRIIAQSLEGDARGQALFAAQVSPVFSALAPYAKGYDIDSGEKFSLTEPSAYVMPSYDAWHRLDVAAQNKAVGRTALLSALVLSGTEPQALYPGVVHAALGALAGTGLATAAEDTATTVLLSMAQEM